MRRKGQRLIWVFIMIISIICACGRKESEESELLPAAQEDTEKVSEEKSEEKSKEVPEEEAEVISVYICGHVHQPGVYELRQGARVIDALEASGGMTEEAACDYLNQAELLTDGQKIYVPGSDEVQTLLEKETESAATDRQDGKVNLNTATKEELMTLGGIGETKADSILKYREEHGKFQSVEDIKNIEGIKEGTFNRIKEQIVVR